MEMTGGGGMFLCETQNTEGVNVLPPVLQVISQWDAVVFMVARMQTLLYWIILIFGYMFCLQ